MSSAAVNLHSDSIKGSTPGTCASSSRMLGVVKAVPSAAAASMTSPTVGTRRLTTACMCSTDCCCCVLAAAAAAASCTYIKLQWFSNGCAIVSGMKIVYRDTKHQRLWYANTHCLATSGSACGCARAKKCIAAVA
jgi:hypothetical protein